MFDFDYTENYKLSFCAGCVLTMFGTLDLGPAHSQVVIQTSPVTPAFGDATKTGMWASFICKYPLSYSVHLVTSGLKHLSTLLRRS